MKVIGMMSGTSLDGIDLCSVVFYKKGGQIHFEIEEAKTYPYEKEWEETLRNAFQKTKEQVYQLDVRYTNYVNETIRKFIEEHSIKGVQLIGSHGHTIWHKPAEGYTLQIGNMPHLRNNLPASVVCNFRVQDVFFGGQGAPLVPIGDELLFASYDFCLNLGGFSNISYREDNKRKAFDICPANILLNEYTQYYFQKDFDHEGILASQGKIDEKLLTQLNSLEFYKTQGPKSLGKEEVATLYQPIINKSTLNAKDVLATIVEHIAIQIGKKTTGAKNAKMLITGGGAYNKYLINRIAHYTKGLQINIPEKKIIDYKEAMIFAFLAYLKKQNSINCLASVTGARQNHSSGQVFL